MGNAHYTQTGEVERYVDTTTGQLIKVRIPRRLTKIEQMNYEKSQPQVWLCTQYTFSPVATGALVGLAPKQSSKPPQMET